MSITGSLTDFSLPEISQFLERGQKSGLLTFCGFPESQAMPLSFVYIWVDQGNIVAAANQLNDRGLVSLIEQYQWASNRVVTKLAQFCPPDKPLGLYLRSQGALQTEQLKHLFQVQVVQQICTLFQLKDTQFKFVLNAPMPGREMTGLSVSVVAIKVMLKKLVILQKLFEERNLLRESSELCSKSENFCHQLNLILDIAFFHSLNLSLFDTEDTFANLSQIVDLYHRPYDLPKSRAVQSPCCKGKNRQPVTTS